MHGNVDALTISVHKNYVDYGKFVKRNKMVFEDLMIEAHNMLLTLEEKSPNLSP
jgi:hypothetical protein